jgi:hypothetical protein
MDDGQAGTCKISNNQEYFNIEKANIQTTCIQNSLQYSELLHTTLNLQILL